uniref:Transmembrane protein 141 n=1 Tax=Coturnix japonica TaxID=93934 RepID=A0A8C2TYB8_COTJA
MKGIGTFVAGTGRRNAAGGALVNRRLPYALQWNLLLSVAAGSLASYTVTRAETQKCSDFWIYLETGTSPQDLLCPHPAAPALSPSVCLVCPCSMEDFCSGAGSSEESPAIVCGHPIKVLS